MKQPKRLFLRYPRFLFSTVILMFLISTLSVTVFATESLPANSAWLFGTECYSSALLATNQSLTDAYNADTDSSHIINNIPADAYFGMVFGNEAAEWCDEQYFSRLSDSQIILWYTQSDYNAFNSNRPFYWSTVSGIVTLGETDTSYYPLGSLVEGEPSTWAYANVGSYNQRWYTSRLEKYGNPSYTTAELAFYGLKYKKTLNPEIFTTDYDAYSIPTDAGYGIVATDQSYAYWYTVEDGYTILHNTDYTDYSTGVVYITDNSGNLTSTIKPIGYESSTTITDQDVPDVWAYKIYSRLYTNVALKKGTYQTVDKYLTSSELYQKYKNLADEETGSIISENIPDKAYFGLNCSSGIYWYTEDDYNSFYTSGFMSSDAYHIASQYCGIILVTNSNQSKTPYYPIGYEVDFGTAPTTYWAYENNGIAASIAALQNITYFYNNNPFYVFRGLSNQDLYDVVSLIGEIEENGKIISSNIPSNGYIGMTADDEKTIFWYTESDYTAFSAGKWSTSLSTGIVTATNADGSKTYYYPIGYKPTSAGSTSTVTTPAVTTPEETKPDETKPAETTPSDSKTETKPSAGIFADMTPAETVATVAVGTTAVAAGATAVYLIANPVVAMEVKAAADVAVAAVAQSVAASPLLGAGAEAVSAGVQAIGTAGVEAVSAGIQTAAASAQAVTAGVQAAAANVQAQVVAYVAPKIEAARNVINGFFAAVAA